MAGTLIKGALRRIYRAPFPGQTHLNVPFGMRNPAVPRSLASLGAKQGSPEAREVYLQLPRRETGCCSSLARSCSVQAAHHREEKTLFVHVKWAEKSGTPALSRRLERAKAQGGSGSHVLQPGCPQATKGGVFPSSWTKVLPQHPHCVPEASPPLSTLPWPWASSHPAQPIRAFPWPQKGTGPCCTPKQWPWALLPDLPVPGPVPPPTVMEGNPGGTSRPMSL